MDSPAERNSAERGPEPEARPPGDHAPRNTPRTTRRIPMGLWLLGGLLGLAALGYTALFGYRFAVIQLGPFAPLALVLTAGLLLAILGPLLLIRYRTPLRAALAHTAQRLGALLAATGLPQRFAARFPRLAHFLSARVARTPTGLTLTVAVLAAAALAWTVLELLFEVVTGSPTVGTDRRILNLVAILRTPQLDSSCMS